MKALAISEWPGKTPPLADRLYLDHAATTPLLPAARETMADELACWANPSSPHAEGRAARARLEDARARIKAALGWSHELIFTGGSSEAIDIALRRSVADRVLASAVEHSAVLRTAGDGPRLPVDADGRVIVDALAQMAVGEGTAEGARALIAVQQVNNETGVIQPVGEIAAAARAANAIFFCDASQGVGKLPLPEADMIGMAAHKFGGPPGMGALLVRDLGLLRASGGQEKGYRGGTENLPGAAGMAAALEANKGWLAMAARLRAMLEEGARALGLEIVAEHAPRIATIGAYRVPGLAASAQLIRFDMAGVAVSAGSACSSGTLKTSPVLSAMGMDEKAAGEVVRLSFGPDTDEAAVERVLSLWAEMRA